MGPDAASRDVPGTRHGSGQAPAPAHPARYGVPLTQAARREGPDISGPSYENG